MRVRIREHLSYSNWYVIEVKPWWSPWWKYEGSVTGKENALRVAKALKHPEYTEIE